MKTNILYIQTDQHRPDILGIAGNSRIQTPNLDRLAAGGILFDHAFCCTAVCTPSRGAVLSGMWPHKSGMIFNPESRASFGHRLCEYDVPVTTFAEVLRETGYHVSNSGKWHIGPRGERGSSAFYGIEGRHFDGYGYPANSKHYAAYLKKHGYGAFRTYEPRGGGVYSTGKPAKHGGLTSSGFFSEHRVKPEHSIPGYLCEDALRYLKKYNKSQEPFFHSINFWGPHVPVNIPPEYLYMYDPEDMQLSENNRNITDNRAAIHEISHRMWGGVNLDEHSQKRIIAAYDGYVSLIDAQLGRVLDYLDKSGLSEQTMIIFTSDHGTTLGAHGSQDKGLNVYDEVYRIPMIINGPLVQKPGSRVSSFISNLDLTPTFVELAGASVPESYDGFSLMPYIEGNMRHVVRKEIIGEAFGHQIPCPQRFIRDKRFKYIFNAVDHDEFYDMIRDPHEQNNIIESIAPRILNRYRKKLLSWAQETGDRQGMFLGMTKMRSDENFIIT